MVKSDKAVKLNIKEISNEKSNIMQENLHGMRHFNHIRQGFEIRSFLSLMIYLVSNLKHIRDNAQVPTICWLLPLLVEINADKLFSKYNAKTVSTIIDGTSTQKI